MNNSFNENKIDDLLRQCAKLTGTKTLSEELDIHNQSTQDSSQDSTSQRNIVDMTNKEKERFSFLEKIGQGGMGTVYKAFDKVLQRTVAVKQIKFTSEESLGRFQIEARSCASLDHPHIVSVYDFQKIGENPCIIMQYIEGCSLAKLLSERTLSLKEIYKIFVQLLEAIGHAHEAGIIHRDLKPGNVLLDNNGKAFITDFGIAKAVDNNISQHKKDLAFSDNHPHTDGILGTPTYMSPEQAKMQEIDSRSDLYSLGTILYEMLTGRQPFTGTNALAIINKVIYNDPFPPKKIKASIPKSWNSFCLKALEKDKNKRFKNAHEMREAFVRGFSFYQTTKKQNQFSYVKDALICLFLLSATLFFTKPLWRSYFHTPIAQENNTASKDEKKISQESDSKKERTFQGFLKRGQFVVRFMKKYDQNEDNKLDILEWPFEKEDFEAVDKDKDQMLNKNELNKIMFKYMGNKDKKSNQQHAKVRFLMDYFNKLDQDNDKQISRDEYPRNRTFDKIDCNNDGFISKKEYLDFFEPDFK